MIIMGYRRIAGHLARGRDGALLAARLVLGWYMLLHGLQKASAPGGVASFQHLLKALGNVPFPGLTGAVLPWVEVTGGSLLLAGVLTRAAAMVLAGEMTIIIGLVKFTDLHVSLTTPLGSPAASAELDLLYLAGLLALLILGPGRLSVDAVAGLGGRTPGPRPAQPVTEPAGLHRQGHGSGRKTPAIGTSADSAHSG